MSKEGKGRKETRGSCLLLSIRSENLSDKAKTQRPDSENEKTPPVEIEEGADEGGEGGDEEGELVVKGRNCAIIQLEERLARIKHQREERKGEIPFGNLSREDTPR